MIKNHKSTELAKLYFKEILKIHQNEAFDWTQKSEALYRLLQMLFVEVTKDEQIQFTTLFSRIAYIGHQYELDKKLQFRIHNYRKAMGKNKWRESKQDLKEEDIYQLGLKVVSDVIIGCFHQEVPAEVEEILPKKLSFPFRENPIKAFKSKVKVLALEDDEDKNQLVGVEEDNPGNKIRIQYNIPERNDNFNSTIQELRRTFQFPVLLNLLDVEIGKDEIYRPKAFVVEPDFLVDVSAVAECFKDFGTAPILYLLKKFLPFESTKYLMIGNIANFFLDELMNNPEATFKEIFPQVFQLNPIAFALFDNRLIREIMNTCQKHYIHLKSMVSSEFSKVNIQPADCYLEPSFYSETYGLQGRLDIFYKNEKHSSIVELKSGKAYRPNHYGISHNHFTQTLLYDLIVKSVFGKEINPTNYILYSGVDNRQLRFAPVVKAQQYEAIQIRNQLVALERRLAKIVPTEIEGDNWEAHTILQHIFPARFPNIKGFAANDLGNFAKVFGSLEILEKKYLLAFTGFIAREHQLAKTGTIGNESRNGLAALWLNDFRTKEENFDIISQLKIKENKSEEVEPIIIFDKTEKTNPLANFRSGDIAVLYPFEEENNAVLSSQIFKCTILKITKETVSIRLRYKQFNQRVFEEHENWNLEHDLLDNNFNSMYRGLFEFAQSPARKKELLLSKNPPKTTSLLDIARIEELTTEQQSILQSALSAKDYFLLWGPPGTGKTSKMLKHLVNWLFSNTEENILLLAYTNRAVDEICEAIESVLTPESYIRIGSRYSTSARFHHRLFNRKVASIKTREALKNLIKDHRIFVSTLASFSSRQDLLKLKTFNRVIIDEASQILEPSLVGLLPNFEQFILIGDHQQLPAVVVQDKKTTTVKDKDLADIGLSDLRNSLFERLFKKCLENNWHWAFAKLSHQGRMHESIMQFPNDHFYGGFLNILPATIPYSKKQQATLPFTKKGVKKESLEFHLQKHRLLFINTKVDHSSTLQKTNLHEAEKIKQIIENLHKIYAAHQKEIEKNSIGIITPYRAQIAQVQSVLETSSINLEKITIDTVERYQGGARDIIILSLCTNSFRQLDTLISLSEEGVDRKLNVALTRAREQVIILGNKEILEENELYRDLIKSAAVFEF